MKPRSCRAKSRHPTERSRGCFSASLEGVPRLRSGRAVLILAASVLFSAAATPQTAIDAEREFAKRAQTEGMWTAFRATAAEDAIMFVPAPTKAHDFLKDRKDPLLSYMWWPAEAYMSCDGKLAVTTGPSVRGAARGYFTTVWAKQPDGRWKWLLDHGSPLEKPRPAREEAEQFRAACEGTPSYPMLTDPRRDPLPDADAIGALSSPDRSLQVTWSASPSGTRKLVVHLWKGRWFDLVLIDEVAGQR